MGTLAERYERVKAMLPPQVKLVAVSKGRTADEIRALYDLGQRVFGENYPQELNAKQALLPQDIEWHFIGHLQTNKVKLIAPFVHRVHAVDSRRLMNELEKRSAGRTIGVLLQVHIASEETKHGFAPDELLTEIQQWDWSQWPHVRVHGLMGMATNTTETEQVRAEFHRLRELFDRTRTCGLFPAGRFTELSMGMTSDARIAIEEGSTVVRIGTALFGER